MTENTIPPIDSRMAELNRRVRARDIGWLREQHSRGELSWLTPHLGQAGYRDLSMAIDAGDMDLVGRQIAVLDDSTTLVGERATSVTTSQDVTTVVPLQSVAGDPLTTDIDDPTLLVSRRGALLPASAVRRERNTLVVVGILLAVTAAAIVAFLLLRSSDDNSDTTVLASNTTIPTDTIAPESTTADSIADTALVTIPASSAAPASSPSSGAPGASVPAPPSSAPGTVLPAASPSNIPVQAPGAPTPLADVITTAGRSATFGPYLTVIEAAGLTDELRTMKNVTILAPTESAFTALPPDVQVALRSPANRTVLARIVRYSVLTQARTAAQLTPGNYPTSEGTPVRVQSVNGAIRVNDATITGPDVKVANGVLHAVDRLLIPPTVDLNMIVAKPGTAAASPTTAATALTTAAPTTTTSPAATAAPVTSAPATAPPTVLTVTTVATASPASTSPASTSPASTSPASTSPASTSPAHTIVATTLAPTTVASTTRPPTTTIA